MTNKLLFRARYLAAFRDSGHCGSYSSLDRQGVKGWNFGVLSRRRALLTVERTVLIQTADGYLTVKMDRGSRTGIVRRSSNNRQSTSWCGHVQATFPACLLSLPRLAAWLEESPNAPVFPHCQPLPSHALGLSTRSNNFCYFYFSPPAYFLLE